jgi:peptidoglycan/xylan/chitin deacetylase (PgdA/CDA1 family)
LFNPRTNAPPAIEALMLTKQQRSRMNIMRLSLSTLTQSLSRWPLAAICLSGLTLISLSSAAIVDNAEMIDRAPYFKRLDAPTPYIEPVNHRNTRPATMVPLRISCTQDNCRIELNDPSSKIAYTCQKPNQIALTFDDGPSDNVPFLLDILDFYEVKATLFVQGKNLGEEKYRAAVKRAAEAGHNIYNHSFDHADFTTLTEEGIIAQVQGTQTAIEELVGDVESWVRPPYGYLNPRVMQTLDSIGFKPILWNLDPFDWDTENVNGALILERIANPLTLVRSLANVQPSFIVLQHDWVYETLLQIPNIIEKGRALGYEFVTLKTCLTNH